MLQHVGSQEEGQNSKFEVDLLNMCSFYTTVKLKIPIVNEPLQTYHVGSIDKRKVSICIWPI